MSESTELPANAIYSENERSAVFEIKAAIRDMTTLGKLLDESMEKLTKAMQALARRKRIKVQVRDFQAQNLESVTLSFS